MSGKHNTEGYRAQVAYLNPLILPVLQAILRDPDTPANTVLQYNHDAMPMRNANLAAHDLPDSGAARLQPSMSSVNAFGGVFNSYLAADLPPPTDISYRSNYDRPSDYGPFVDKMAGCQAEGS